MSARQGLYDLLARYQQRFPGETALAARFVAFAQAHPDCLWRSCVPGHITASCWIVSADCQRGLLTQHRKLARWLQLGGHVDGAADLAAAALREAREESGIQQFTLVPWQQTLVPLDLDVHVIPARKQEPEHLHWDVRFLLHATCGEALTMSDESTDLRWVPLQDLASYTQEDSVLRLHHKARGILRP